MSTRELARVSGLALAVVASAAVARQAPPQQAAPTLLSFHFKEPRPFPLDTTRIAIFDAGATLDQSTPPGLEPMAIKGWWLASLPADRRTERGVRDALADLSIIGIDAQRAAANDLFASPVGIGDDGGPVIATRDIIVRFEDGVPPGYAEQTLAAMNIGTITARDFGGMKNTFLLRASAADGRAVIDDANMLAQHPLVRFAEPNRIFTGRSDLIPNDPGFANCWGLRHTGQFGGPVDFDMDVSEAWDITQGTPSIIIVVLDTGVQQDHPDINQIPGQDFIGQNGGGGPVNACDNHGTAVAGCITGIINNNLGTCGVAPSCKVASARPFISSLACDGSWSSDSVATINALAWALSIGARVTNNSNQYGGLASTAIEDKYADLRLHGVISFASAGNFSSSQITFPANVSSVNGIAALAPNGARASFSNYGVGLDYSAPGASVYSTDRTGSAGYYSGDYGFVDGTSFASPYTAGVAALVLTQTPSLTPFQVDGLLQSTCTDLGPVGYDTDFGWGMPNAYQALTGSPPPPPLPPGPFSLLTPANGATGVPVNTALDWSDATNAASYIVTLDNNADFSSPLFSLSLATTQLTLTPGTLQQGVLYHWKVVARNEELVTTASTPAVASFTTFVPPPPCIGDANNDHRVDTQDLTILLGFFGSSLPIGTPPDFDANGTVNTADLTILLGQFGNICS